MNNTDSDNDRLPGETTVKNLPVNTGNTGDVGSIPGLGRSPRIRNGNPLQYSLPGKFHRQMSLARYSLWGRRVGCNSACTHTHTHSDNDAMP